MKRFEKVALSLVMGSMSALSGCSAMKNMDEMRNTTNHMAATTDHMDGNMNSMVGKTDHMSTKTDHMADKMDYMADKTDHVGETSDALLNQTNRVVHLSECEMYVDMRQGDSATLRMRALERLEKTEAVEGKIMDAATYFMSFEFQLWKGTGCDSQEKLQRLYSDSIEQFFKDAKRYYDDHERAHPTLNPITGAPKNIQALAAAMYLPNPNQADDAKARGAVPISFLRVVENALKAEKKVNSGELMPAEIPRYIHEALVHRDDIVYMLNVRMNTMAAAVLAKFTGIEEDRGLINKLRSLNEVSVLMFNDWTAPIDKLSVSQLREFTEYLSWSNQARDFLRSIGEEPKADGMILRMYRHMKFPAQAGLTDEQKVHAEAASEFEAEIESYRNDPAKVRADLALKLQSAPVRTIRAAPVR
jgi:hypothetical protein